MRPNIYEKQSTNRRKNSPPGPCYICGDQHWMRFCPAKKKKTYKNCGKVGHEVTRCWYTKKLRKPRNKIRQTQSGDNEDGNLHKYVKVKIFNKTEKFQLDTGSDLSIINLYTSKQAIFTENEKDSKFHNRWQYKHFGGSGPQRNVDRNYKETQSICAKNS